MRWLREALRHGSMAEKGRKTVTVRKSFKELADQQFRASTKGGTGTLCNRRPHQKEQKQVKNNIFGWDLPPGCTQRQIDDALSGGDPSELVENVLGLLEDAGVSTEINDQIVALIERWEKRWGGIT